jgi:ABC-type phosphate transport system substrate-binding protein
VLGAGEGELTSNECLEKDRNPAARIIRCERDTNKEIVDLISGTPGAIGYADAPAITQARRTHNLVVLTLDGKAFNTATAVDSGYPFWTVEYLYTRQAPPPGSLAANVIDFARKHVRARDKLTEVGFRPCYTPQGPLELCNLR